MRVGDPTEQLQLRDYLIILRRRWPVIALAMALCGGLAFVMSNLQTRLYTAEAEILLAQSSSGAFLDPNSGVYRTDPRRDLENALELASSQLLGDQLEQTLDRVPDVSARTSTSSDVLRLQAISADPVEAAEVANAYAEQFVELRRSLAVEGFDSTAAVVQEFIDDVQQRLAALDGRTGDSVVRERRSLTSQLEYRQGQLDTLTVNQNLAAQSADNIITRATTPTAPFRPSPKRNTATGLTVGLLIGLAAAFVIDHLDDTVKGKGDLEEVTGGLISLSLVPVQERKYRDRSQLVAVTEPASPVAEAYRSLRTSIQFVGLKQSVRSIQVTSSRAGEGKTTTIANLAVTIAQGGQRVTLIDCDLRNPQMHHYFGLPAHIGFTSVLLGELSLGEALCRIEDVPNLRVLCAGLTPPNPSELLGSSQTPEIIASLQAEGDIVLIDGPPVLPVTDALVLSYVVDATVFVAKAGDTKMKEAQLATEGLRRVDANLVGTVLNGVSSDSGNGYGYGYGYGYGVNAPKQSKRRELSKRRDVSKRPDLVVSGDR